MEAIRNRINRKVAMVGTAIFIAMLPALGGCTTLASLLVVAAVKKATGH
jgi:hypothetical protein